MGRVILGARGIKKGYITGKTVLEVLKGVNIDLEEGNILAIIGESGAGKSTLLHILGLLDRPTEGKLILEGSDLSDKTDIELAEIRNSEIGFIFQFHHLLPEFDALENVVMPSLINGKKIQKTRDRAEYLLNSVGLGERLEHKPTELSGGELQRVAVARALMNEPRIILADEPSGNLDHRNSEMLHDLIWDLAREHNCSFVVVTHDMELAKKADRVMLMDDGLLFDNGLHSK